MPAARLSNCYSSVNLAWISHHGLTLRGPREGRGFSPAEIAAPTRFLSRARRSLRPQAAPGAGHRKNQEGQVAVVSDRRLLPSMTTAIGDRRYSPSRRVVTQT